MTTKQTQIAASKMKRSNYFIPENLRRGMEELGARKGVSAAEIVRQSVAASLRRNRIKF